jgi:quercetin dioxygenase-like cupin family protein
MRTALQGLVVCVTLASVAAGAHAVTPSRSVVASRGIPLILEKNEGERRIWRPIEGAAGWDAQPGPFILKVDPHNGRSSHLVFGTEDLPPGAKIDRHRHPGADEILLLQSGNARVSLGDRTRDVHGGATVYIPANTWISVTNTGTSAISCVFVFSAPGFDDFMRAESVLEGQKVAPLTKAEDARIMKVHAHAVVYAEP